MGFHLFFFSQALFTNQKNRRIRFDAMSIKTKPAKTVLIQTRIPKDKHVTIAKRATVEGISVAAYVRRLVLRDAEKGESNA